MAHFLHFFSAKHYIGIDKLTGLARRLEEVEGKGEGGSVRAESNTQRAKRHRLLATRSAAGRPMRGDLEFQLMPSFPRSY